MSGAKVGSELGLRLERLTGEGAECCVPEYRQLLREIQSGPGFRMRLAQASALADERRLTIAAMLRRRDEMCACEIQAALGLSHATVSHHMAILEEAGLVGSRRNGKWVHYRLTRVREVEIP